MSAQSSAAIAPQFKGDLPSYLLVSHLIWKLLSSYLDICISISCMQVLELAEFKAGMVEHPVTGKILREKTLDSLLATM